MTNKEKMQQLLEELENVDRRYANYDFQIDVKLLSPKSCLPDFLSTELETDFREVQELIVERYVKDRITEYKLNTELEPTHFDLMGRSGGWLVFNSKKYWQLQRQIEIVIEENEVITDSDVKEYDNRANDFFGALSDFRKTVKNDLEKLETIISETFQTMEQTK